MMRQMRLAGLNKNKLAALVGSSRQQIGKLAQKPTISKEWAEKCAPFLECSPLDLVMGGKQSLGAFGMIGSSGNGPWSGPGLLDAFDFEPEKAAQPQDMKHMLPVYGSAQGGNGDGFFELNGNVIDHVKCPPALETVKGAYCLRVTGMSMEPRYFEGELLYVNPSKPVGPGAFVVIQLKPKEGDPVKAVVKQLVRRTSEKLVVHQYQPDMDYDIPADTVLAVHRVVNGEELF